MNLNQVTVFAADVGACAAFYRLLGLRLIVDSLPRYVRFECPEGTGTFSVHETTASVPSGNSPVIYFECADLDVEVARLQAAGVEVDEGPMDMPWLWREARLRDPAGNRICLYRAGSNRRHPPWRVPA